MKHGLDELVLSRHELIVKLGAETWIHAFWLISKLQRPFPFWMRWSNCRATAPRPGDSEWASGRACWRPRIPVYQQIHWLILWAELQVRNKKGSNSSRARWNPDMSSRVLKMSLEIDSCPAHTPEKSHPSCFSFSPIAKNVRSRESRNATALSLNP